MIKRIIFIITIILVALTFLACPKKGTKTVEDIKDKPANKAELSADLQDLIKKMETAISEAERIIESAKQANAEKYDTMNLNKAVDYLDEAIAKKQKSEYQNALDNALLSQKYGKLARDNAIARAENETLINQQLADLKESAEKAIKDAEYVYNAAVNAEAEKYANELLENAKLKLSESKSKYKIEEYKKSILLANKSKNFSQQALNIAIQKMSEEDLQKIIHKLTKYQVIQGDCLWNIAKKDVIYGNPWLWKRIWIRNKEKIADYDLIYPEQIFQIPR